MSDRPDDSQQPEKKPQEGGWYAPEGAVTGRSASDANSGIDVPLPASEAAQQSGMWRLPPDRQERQTTSPPIAQETPVQQEVTVPVEALAETPAEATQASEIIDEPYPYATLTDEQPDIAEAQPAPVQAEAEAREIKVNEEAQPSQPQSQLPTPSQPESETKPVIETTAQPSTTSAAAVPKENLPEGAALSTEVDYSNYVPGVGFVQPSQSAQKDPPAAAALPVREPSAGVVTQTDAPIAPGTSSQTPTPVPQSTSAAAVSPVVEVTPTPAATSASAAVSPASTGNTGNTGVSGDQLAAELAQPAANQALTQKFIDVEKSVQGLRRRYTSGLMTRDQLQAELRKLMILDEQGYWWMIGLESDRWYQYDGRNWNPAIPPGYSATGTPPAGIAATGASAASSAVSSTSAAQAAAPSRKVDIPVDEYGMPPQRVPVEDPGATIVGRAAPKLDNTLKVRDMTNLNARLAAEKKATSTSAAFNAGATVPSAALGSQVTQPAAAISPSAVSVPAPGSASGLTQGVVPEKPKSIQPDYGPRPQSWINDRQRRVGCLIQIAVAGVFLFLALAVLGTIGSVLFYTTTINQYSGRIDALASNIAAETQSVKFYDSSGRMIYQLNDPNLGARTVVPLADISPYLIHAVVATENERFYSDPGFDVVAIIRAILQNLRAGGSVSGASTLTQQLTRAKVLDPGAANDISAGRKITEILVASEVARRYTKSQILEFYLNNTAYFGNLAYGVEAAAQTYFKKSAKDLTMVESAFLAGLIQSPAGYDPALDGGVSAIARTKVVLGLMVNLGCLQTEHLPQPICVTKGNPTADPKFDVDSGQTLVELSTLTASMVQFKPTAQQVTYPHFVNYVKQILEDQYGQDALYNGGFSVYTTIDPRIQDAAELAARNQVNALRGQNVGNAAVVVIDPRTGGILAMVGSVDFNNANIDGQVNVAINPRQPGSSIKPFVYASSMEQAPDGSYWYPGTVIWDIPTDFNGYQPVNYNRGYRGPMTMRSALAMSENIPAVKALEFVTVPRFQAFADRIGLRFPLVSPADAGLTTALGGVEVTLLDMVRGYSIFANGGQQIPTFAISKITRKNGANEETVFEYSTPAGVQLVDPAISWMITSILSDNAARTPGFGANSVLNIPGTAVKTGTTNDYKDNWTIGYTPQFVVGVWVGNTRGEPMNAGVTGLTGAAPIWNQVMLAALSGQAPQGFNRPPEIQETTICADFGTLNFAQCRNARNEYYRVGLPPPGAETAIQILQVDKFSGLRANNFCPNFVEERAFVNISDTRVINWINNTDQGRQWLDQSGWKEAYNLQIPIAQAPTGECQANQPQPVIQIANPQPGQTVSGLVQILGSANVPNFRDFQLEIGVGVQATQFQLIAGPFRVPQANGALGVWDSSTVAPGDYTLRLIAFDQQGRSADVTVPIRVSNVPMTETPAGQIIPTSPGVPTAFPTTDPGIFATPLPINPTETPIVIDGSNPIVATPTPIDVFPPTTAP
ncbi:MAG: transglycosylase domain-containing protein [Anaerolineae bacterium]